MQKKREDETNQNISAKVGITDRQIRNVAQRMPKISVSSRTITRYLKDIGWSRKKATRIPRLCEAQKIKRVNWAKSQRDTDWSHLVFSDECNLSLGECRYGWSKKGSRLQQERSCYEQKIQLFGAMSSEGLIYYTEYEGTLKAPDYINLLEGEFINSAYNIMGDDWTFQQDGAKPHAAKETMAFLKEEVPNVLPRPANSPDINPIENLWGILKQQVYNRNPETLDEMSMFIEEEIEQIPRNVYKNLVDSMYDRIEMIIENQGNVISIDCKIHTCLHNDR